MFQILRPFLLQHLQSFDWPQKKLSHVIFSVRVFMIELRLYARNVILTL